MKLGNDNDYIEICVLEESSMTQNLGDIRLSVKVSMSEFVGEYDQIWIEGREKNRFISDLVKLEEKRKGSANIESMSPNEFALNISTIDSLGHLQADIQLSKYNSGINRGPDVISLSGGFEFDPMLLPAFVQQISKYAD